MYAAILRAPSAVVVGVPVGDAGGVRACGKVYSDMSCTEFHCCYLGWMVRLMWRHGPRVNRWKVSEWILNHQLDERISCAIIGLAVASWWLGNGPCGIAKLA